MSARASILLRAAAAGALALALLRSVLAVYFSAEIVPLPPGDEVAAPRLAERVLLIVIDGLRHDTALESGWMPGLERLGAGGAAGVALAGQVTMTGLGVRTIGTGTSPALADLLLDPELPPFEHDSPLARLHARGGRIVFVGNPAWRELFGRHLARDDSSPGTVEILALVDNIYAADALWVRRALRLLERDDWELAIVHLGGVDNASHRFTPFGPAFRHKVGLTDRDIGRLVARAGARTTVIVTSDHGTSARGHHGSAEPEARRTPLVLAGPGIRPGVRLEARQIDLAPTLAVLLGLPLPAPSEGRVLTEALALEPVEESAVRAANARQLARYAHAYAAAHGLQPPAVAPTASGLRALSDWIERARSRASVIPPAWAAALALFALGHLVRRRRSASADAAWALAAAAGLGNLAGDGRSLPASALALGAAALAAALELRTAPRPRPLAALVGGGLLCGVELLVAWWRLHRRAVEIFLADLSRAAPRGLGLLALCAGGLAIVAGALYLRRRLAWWAGPWAAVGALALLAALQDSLAIPSAICAGALVLVAALPEHPVRRLVGAARALRPRAPALVLVAFGAAAVTVRTLGNPPVAYHWLLEAGGAALLITAACQRGPRALETLGLGAALLLAVLSRPAQIPLLAALTVCALVAGRIELRWPLFPAVILIALRFGLFALYEGAFELSRLEVWLGYEGNPGTQVAWGASVIGLKFVLAFVLAAALVTARLSAALRRQVLGLAAAFLVLRIGHVILSMTLARGTFYSPYVDAGQLLFTFAMLASLLLAGGALEGLFAARKAIDWARSYGVSQRAPAGSVPAA
ncbi:MAG TPA: alkaline phosphatase family protein [Polyangia bacterium]|nr:alkaline phosphatase family protein [Polyangia bacterium]